MLIAKSISLDQQWRKNGNVDGCMNEIEKFTNVATNTGKAIHIRKINIALAALTALLSCGLLTSATALEVVKEKTPALSTFTILAESAKTLSNATDPKTEKASRKQLVDEGRKYLDNYKDRTYDNATLRSEVVRTLNAIPLSKKVSEIDEYWWALISIMLANDSSPDLLTRPEERDLFNKLGLTSIDLDLQSPTQGLIVQGLLQNAERFRINGQCQLANPIAKHILKYSSEEMSRMPIAVRSRMQANPEASVLAADRILSLCPQQTDLNRATAKTSTGAGRPFQIDQLECTGESLSRGKASVQATLEAFRRGSISRNDAKAYFLEKVSQIEQFSACTPARPGQILMTLYASLADVYASEGKGREVSQYSQKYIQLLETRVIAATSDGLEAPQQLLWTLGTEIESVHASMFTVAQTGATVRQILEFHLLLRNRLMEQKAAALRWAGDESAAAYKNYRSLASMNALNGGGRVKSRGPDFPSSGRSSSISASNAGSPMTVMPISILETFRKPEFRRYLTSSIPSITAEEFISSSQRNESYLVIGNSRRVMESGVLSAESDYYGIFFRNADSPQFTNLGRQSTIDYEVERIFKAASIDKSMTDDETKKTIESFGPLGKLINLAKRPGEAVIRIFPDGAFWHLPFEKIKDSYGAQADTTGSDVNVVLDASPRSVVQRRKQKWTISREATVFSAPPARARINIADCLELSSQQLPMAETEGALVAGLLGKSVKVYAGDNASERSVKEDPLRGIVHFAAHGVNIEVDCPRIDRNLAQPPSDGSSDALANSGYGANAGWRSFLLLQEATSETFQGSPANQVRNSSGRIEDGLLTSEEILGIDFSKVSLVFAAACYSGKGVSGNDGSDYSLRSAFSAAGSRAQISSLWALQDDLVARFVNEFYKAFAGGKTEYRSYLAAKAALRTEASTEISSEKRQAIKRLLDGLFYSGDAD